MERLTAASDYERGQAQAHARVVAFGALVVGFAMTSLIVMGSTGQYSGLDFWYAVMVGLTFWGVMYGLVYITALPPSLPDSDHQDTPDDDPPPPLPATAPPPQINSNGHHPALQPEIKQQLSMVWNGRLQVGGRLVVVPDTVHETDLLKIQAARQTGQLETVSQRGLDAIDISRWTESGARVKNLIAFLDGAGAIDEEGNWTAAGQLTFPSPAPVA